MTTLTRANLFKLDAYTHKILPFFTFSFKHIIGTNLRKMIFVFFFSKSNEEKLNWTVS